MRQEIKEAIDMYAKYHLPVGGFLRAVLANDLMETFSRADPENFRDIYEICLYIHWEIPGNCHGSYEIVDKWIKEGKELEKEISVEDMQKIMDVNEKLVKELKDGKSSNRL